MHLSPVPQLAFHPDLSMLSLDSEAGKVKPSACAPFCALDFAKRLKDRVRILRRIPGLHPSHPMKLIRPRGRLLSILATAGAEFDRV